MVLVDVDITTGSDDGIAQKVRYSSNGSPTTTTYELETTQTQIEMTPEVGRYIIGTDPPRTFSQDIRGYFLFKGITIPIGSTIDDATLNLRGVSSSSGIARVYGRKTNYPTVPTGSGTSIFTKPVATAFGTTTVPTTTTTGFGVDMKSTIQELVNTFDYNNDNIMLIMKPITPVLPTTPVSTSVSNSIQVDAFEGIGTEANLIVNYTAPLVDLQLLKPISDISNTGAWEDVTFGNGDTELWDELNEITPDDDGSAVLSLINPTSADTFEVKLQSTGEPPTDFNHKIKFRVRSNSGGGQIKAQLYQGTTLIAESPFETLTSSYQTFEYTLSGGEAGAITDYTDLRIRMVPV